MWSYSFHQIPWAPRGATGQVYPCESERTRLETRVLSRLVGPETWNQLKLWHICGMAPQACRSLSNCCDENVHSLAFPCQDYGGHWGMSRTVTEQTDQIGEDRHWCDPTGRFETWETWAKCLGPSGHSQADFMFSQTHRKREHVWLVVSCCFPFPLSHEFAPKFQKKLIWGSCTAACSNANTARNNDMKVTPLRGPRYTALIMAALVS